jgi:hypothetical protein
MGVIGFGKNQAELDRLWITFAGVRFLACGCFSQEFVGKSLCLIAGCWDVGLIGGLMKVRKGTPRDSVMLRATGCCACIEINQASP